MQVQRATADGPTRRAAPSGFSLVEVMVVIVIIGILAAISVPAYQRAIEQSRADIAAANLRAIWAAQRLYWIEYHAYAPNLTDLRALGLVDPEIVLSVSGYSYTVTSAGNNNFGAAATRTGATGWAGGYTIDETGTIAGGVQATGLPTIVPGFQ
jgi:prepilin-type N-terminal cleavage/methylation domain-containing protein